MIASPDLKAEYPAVDLPEEPSFIRACAARDCQMPAPGGPFRADTYCPAHQLVFRITKKLAHIGFGAPRYVRPLQQMYGLGVGGGRTSPLGRSKQPGRNSKKGIWLAAEQVLMATRRKESLANRSKS